MMNLARRISEHLADQYDRNREKNERLIGFIRSKPIVAFMYTGPVLAVTGGAVEMLTQEYIGAYTTGCILVFLGFITAAATWFAYSGFEIQESWESELAKRKTAELLIADLKRKIEEISEDPASASQVECENCDASFNRGVSAALRVVMDRQKNLDAFAPAPRSPSLRVVKTEDSRTS